MEQKEKGICIGDENMVKCATVRPFTYSVFISHRLQNSRINVGSRLYLALSLIVDDQVKMELTEHYNRTSHGSYPIALYCS